MSDDFRMVAMTAEQYEEVERCIGELMRAFKNERAATLMNLALAYKFAKPAEPATPSNVIPLYSEVTHAGDNWSRKSS